MKFVYTSSFINRDNQRVWIFINNGNHNRQKKHDLSNSNELILVMLLIQIYRLKI